MSQKDVILEDELLDCPELFWDSTYAIAMALIDQCPHVQPETVGLFELADLVEQLEGFVDDPALATDRILLDIQTVWVEENVP
ncbi:MAG: Fe-S cluster assembly protein IscX [Candidatus Promineifilaceae bacterium]